MRIYLIIATLVAIISMVYTQYNRHGLPDQNWFINKLFYEYGSEKNNETLNLEDLGALMDAIGIKYFPHPPHASYKRLQKPRAEYQECFDTSDLSEIFEIDNVTNIDKKKFKDLGSALILMSVTHDCIHNHDHENEEECNSLSTRYLYGSLTVIVISVVSFASVALVGKFGKLKSKMTISLTGLAFGTLLSDTMLHLIPAALNIHDDSAEDPLSDIHDEEDNHSHDHDTTYVWVLSVTILTVLVLWLLETFLDTHSSHGHSHSTDAESGNHKSSNNELEIEEVAEVEVKNSSCIQNLKKVQSRGWTMVFGDALHNLTDGLAIAASFSQSPSLGISTGLAILFHEIPHEISAFVVFRKFGFGYLYALVLNIISGLISLITFLIVTAATGEPNVWLFAITSGVFIYISLVDLLPDLKETFAKNKNGRDWVSIALVLFFIIVGWTLMLLLAIFEDDIQIDFNISC